VNVQLTEYPYFDGTMMRVDHDLLERLADEHAGADGPMTRFLFGAVPVALFDEIFRADDPAALALDAYLWLFHLSGYYGGIWLRGELVESGHNAMIANVNLPPSEEQFAEQVGRASGILDAAGGPAVLADAEGSLFDAPDPLHPDQVQPGLVDSFGYNQGYLLQIAERPPAGLTTPPGFVSCPADPADGPLFCEYATTNLAVLHDFDGVAAKLRDRTGVYGDLADRIVPVQRPAIARGRTVWDGQLDVQGFSQDAYVQLLDISSAFLETVQVTALATVHAVAERDRPVARRAAAANAMMTVWLRSYLVGLTDGRDVALPSFTR
jgi:hypothetical protein